MKLFLLAATAIALFSASAAPAQNWQTQQMLNQQQLTNDIQGMITEQQLSRTLAATQQRLQQSMPGYGQRPNCVNGWVVGAYMQMC